MEYVHRCVVCDWQRPASSPTVTSPRCENCGCTLEAVYASDMDMIDRQRHSVQLPEGLRQTLVRLGTVTGGALLFLAAARTGYAEGGFAIAVAAVGVAGLVVVSALSAERA